MDITRAKAILDSDDTIQVLYQGEPVWIEKVQDNNTAIVSRAENTGKDKEAVPVYLLVENKSVKN